MTEEDEDEDYNDNALLNANFFLRKTSEYHKMLDKETLFSQNNILMQFAEQPQQLSTLLVEDNSLSHSRIQSLKVIPFTKFLHE